MVLSKLEFQTLPGGEVEVRPLEGLPFVLQEENKEFINEFIEVLSCCYTEALAALEDEYKKSRLNTTYFRFLIVRRFIKCNFANLDNKLDINNEGKFLFEYVTCPMAGECKLYKIVCNPTFNSTLSKRQLEIAKMYVDGKTSEQIASELYLSTYTVKAHRGQIYEKLGIHSIIELSKYMSSWKN